MGFAVSVGVWSLRNDIPEIYLIACMHAFLAFAMPAFCHMTEPADDICGGPIRAQNLMHS